MPLPSTCIGGAASVGATLALSAPAAGKQPHNPSTEKRNMRCCTGRPREIDRRCASSLRGGLSAPFRHVLSRLCGWLQVPGAHGRYITCHKERYSVKAVAEILSKRFPQYKFSSTKEGSPMPGFDNSKVRGFISSSHALCSHHHTHLLSKLSRYSAREGAGFLACWLPDWHMPNGKRIQRAVKLTITLSAVRSWATSLMCT